MTRDEWFERVAHDGNLFEDEDEEVERRTFKKYQDSLPENFIHMDVDCCKNAIEASEVPNLISAFRQRALELLDKTKRYCLE